MKKHFPKMIKKTNAIVRPIKSKMANALNNNQRNIYFVSGVKHK